MQGRGALWVFAASDILRDNFLHLLLLPPCPQFKYFPILNLQSPLPTGGVAIMGHSMVETVSIILSAEAGKGEGGRRLEMPKATMPTNIEQALSTLVPSDHPKYLPCFDPSLIVWFCSFLHFFFFLNWH